VDRRGEARENGPPYKSSYAIIAAIDKYDRPGDKRGPTPYDASPNMVAGAKKLRETLEWIGFPHDNIEALYDEEATSENIEKAMRTFWQGAEHGDAGRLLIYFGGHGDTDEYGSGFLVTYDFDPKKPKLTSIPMSEFVSTQFRGIDAHHVLVAIDSCSSGLAIPGMRTLGEKNDEDWLNHFATLAEIDDDLKYRARQLLVAGTGKDQAIDDDGGIFTEALTNGLKGGADLMHEGVIDFGELAFYVRREVRSCARAMHKEQVPSAFTGDAFGRGSYLFLLPARQ
jgi:hypothetical protein